MSRPIALPSPWLELARHAGSVKALAEALSTTPRTIQRWASGDRVPDVLWQRAANAWARRRGLAVPWADV